MSRYPPGRHLLERACPRSDEIPYEQFDQSPGPSKTLGTSLMTWISHLRHFPIDSPTKGEIPLSLPPRDHPALIFLRRRMPLSCCHGHSRSDRKEVVPQCAPFSPGKSWGFWGIRHGWDGRRRRCASQKTCGLRRQLPFERNG